MIRYNQSNINQQKVLHFFSGEKISSGNYLYEESNTLYGAENLAPNLIEYDKLEQLPIDTKKNKFILEVVDNISDYGAHKISLVDTRIDPALRDADISIDYGSNISDIFQNIIEGTLVKIANLNIKLIKNETLKNHFFFNYDSTKILLFKLSFSSHYIQQRQGCLSHHLINHFDSTRYDDILASSALLMTSFGAITKA